MKQVFNPLSGSFDLVEDKASKINYTPSTASDWEGSPTKSSEALDELGSRKSSIDVFVQLKAYEELTDWSTGDNATFLGGGTLAGTFEKETVAPLNGVASYKYTQAASSLDDYIASPAQAVPLRFRGQTCSISMPFNYDGSNSDLNLVIYDVTNAAELYNEPFDATNGTTNILKANFIIPLSCTSIRVGFHVKALSSGSILNFDDIQISDNTLKYTDISNISEWQSYTPTFTGFGTVSASSVSWRRVGANIEIRGRFTTGTPIATEARISFPLNYLSISNITNPNIVGVFAKSTGPFSGSFNVLVEPSVSYFTFGISGASNTGLTKLNGNGFIVAGEDISFFASVPIQGLLAGSPSIITPSESFSSDTALFSYAGSSQYTISTLPNSPVGTFITDTYTAGSNTRTQTNASPPSQSTSDMNVNGIRVFTRPFGSASTSGNPTTFYINIGKGFKSVSLNLFKSTGKTTAGEIDSVVRDSTDQYGLMRKNYNPETGVLQIDAGLCQLTSISTSTFQFSDYANQTNGYLVINASKSPALVGVPELIPRIATISDVKASGTNGGTATAGSYQTRTINTLIDPTGFVTSLSSNQFILPAGEYFFDITAPVRQVDMHKIRLRNITDSSDALIGDSNFAPEGGSGGGNIATIKGHVVISSPKTFEIQHRVQTTRATSGYGFPCSFGDSEVYTQVEIQKIK